MTSELLAQVRAEAQSAGSNRRYIDVVAVDELLQPALRPLRVGAATFASFGLLALTIAGVGLAVVTGDSVARRQREFGIRMALGAEPGQRVRGVIAGTLGAASAGLTLGTLLAYVGSPGLRSLRFEVAHDYLRVYRVVTAAFLAISILAAYVPARRAGGIDPAESLRTE